MPWKPPSLSPRGTMESNTKNSAALFCCALLAFATVCNTLAIVYLLYVQSTPVKVELRKAPQYNQST
jgi:hypothetical protein